MPLVRGRGESPATRAEERLLRQSPAKSRRRGRRAESSATSSSTSATARTSARRRCRRRCLRSAESDAALSCCGAWNASLDGPRAPWISLKSGRDERDQLFLDARRGTANDVCGWDPRGAAHFTFSVDSSTSGTSESPHSGSQNAAVAASDEVCGRLAAGARSALVRGVRERSSVALYAIVDCAVANRGGGLLARADATVC